jgi:poly-D-alanine transfer protein DltD
MKVYENLGPVLPISPKNTHKNGAKEDEFQQIMDQVQAGAMKSEETANPGSIAPQSLDVRILQRTEQPGSSTQVKQLVLNELRSTLDLVDFYAEKLGNTSLPVTDLDPLVEHLDERLKNLQNMESAKGLPDKLRPIVNDVVVTLGTEIAKFRRGDYS